MNRLYIKLSKTKFIKLEKSRSHKYIRKMPDGKGGWIYFYEKTIQNKFKEDRREFGDKNALKIMQEIIKTRNKEIEHSTCYDISGNSILYKTGHEYGVDFTDIELNKIKNSRLLIHNHTDGKSFSDKDFKLLLFCNIQEIRAFGNKNNERSNYSIKRIKKMSKEQQDEFFKIYSEDVAKNKKILQDRINNREIKIPDAEKLFYEYNLLKFLQIMKGYYKYEKY